MLDYSIGKRCQYSICKQQDFLPFCCQLCKGSFCIEHRTPDSHECPKQPIKKQAIICPICNKGIAYKSNVNENEAWEIHYENDCTLQQAEKKQCPICRLKLTTLNSVNCKDCGIDICLKHRQQEDHKCKALGLWQMEKQQGSHLNQQNTEQKVIQNSQSNQQQIQNQQNLQTQQTQQTQQNLQSNESEICPICGKKFNYLMQLIRHAENCQG